MSTIAALSKDRHADKRWKRYSNYTFAKADAVAPLLISELPKALLSLPIAFIRQEDAYLPVAVLGLEAGKNLLVAPDGRWAGQYVPAVFRAYPFLLAKQDEQLILCVNEASGLIVEGAEGEALFDDEGKPTAAIQTVLDFLVNVENSRQATATACAALEKHGCIRAWPITHKVSTDNERKIEGLFQIDESALNALADDAFIELKNTGALLLAYAQLLSMQHLSSLGQLADAHAQVAATQLKQQSQPKELDLSFLSDGGLFKFDN
jgi:hypothetical protein